MGGRNLVPFRSASFPHFTHPKGFYDLEYAGGVRDCRGRLVADKDGRYEYRAVVPISYPMVLNVSNLLLCLRSAFAVLTTRPLRGILYILCVTN